MTLDESEPLVLTFYVSKIFPLFLSKFNLVIGVVECFKLNQIVSNQHQLSKNVSFIEFSSVNATSIPALVGIIDRNKRTTALFAKGIER